MGAVREIVDRVMKRCIILERLGLHASSHNTELLQSITINV